MMACRPEKLSFATTALIPTRSRRCPLGAASAKNGIFPLEEPLILFLSRLIPRKGADILIESFAEACPQKGRLVIAGPEGESGYRAQLENCAKNSRRGVARDFHRPIV